MNDFIYNGLPARVLFGSGTSGRIKSELELAGCRRALVLATPEQETSAHRISDALGDLAAGIFTQATMHTPVAVTEKALRFAEQLKADCTVAIGGGSTTGLGKAIALRTDLTQFVIPTTYAGSEMTPILGETKDGAKATSSTMST
jgi:maleylacetate reductase